MDSKKSGQAGCDFLGGSLCRGFVCPFNKGSYSAEIQE